jgi:putative inorganic carbon (HCO3(-)) transporter
MLLPSNPLIKIFLAILAVFLLSSLNSYFGHNTFYRPSIISEFRRVWIFTILNSFFPFLLAQYLRYDENNRFPFSLWFVFLWGGAWFLFPYLRSQHIFFDAYAMFLWIVALYYLTKKTDFNFSIVLNLFMLSGFYASVYGIMQYFGIEIIWSKALNPYGGRPVTTFGNPNFVSSYVLMLFPISIFYFLKASDKKSRFIYFLYSIAYVSMIFASMTRSSLFGLFFEVIFIILVKDFRDFVFRNIQISKKIFITFFVILILWPSQDLKPFSFGIAKRIYEGISKSISNVGFDIKKQRVYQSFHQRLLIWSCGMEMFLENPILGKGWGSFELFYPFYQGKFLREYPSIRHLRTHANNAHNEIVEILSQTGILGLGVCLYFVFLIFYYSFRFLNYAGNDNRKILVISLLSSIGGMFVDNMMNVSIHFATPGLLFFFVIGFLSSIIFGRCLVVEIKKIYKYILLLLILISILLIYFWYLQFMRELYYFEGFKLVRKGNIVGAINALEKAFNFEGREVNNNYELANAYARTGNYEKAIYMYHQALKANAGYDEIYFNLGVIEKKSNLYNESIDNFKTSLWINPMNEKSYYAIFEIINIIGNKKFDDLKLVIADGIKVHPQNPYLNSIMGYLKEKDGDFKEASFYYRKSVENEPSNKLYLDNYMRVAKQIDKNLIDFVNLYNSVSISNNYNSNLVKDKLNSLEPYFKNNTRFLYLKAKYLYDTEKYKEAEEILTKIIEEDPLFYSARYALGVLYEKTARINDAIRVYEECLSYNPDLKEISIRLDKLKRMK